VTHTAGAIHAHSMSSGGNRLFASAQQQVLTHTRTHTHTHTHTRTHVRTRTHTHIHTHSALAKRKGYSPQRVGCMYFAGAHMCVCVCVYLATTRECVEHAAMTPTCCHDTNSIHTHAHAHAHAHTHTHFAVATTFSATVWGILVASDPSLRVLALADAQWWMFLGGISGTMYGVQSM
jgi:hypothetical protein